MKILLVTDSYTNLINGVAIVVATLADSYQKMGHDVRVLTVSGNTKAKREDDVYYIPSFKVPMYPDLRFSLIHTHPYLSELKAWKPDIVHIHSEGSTARMAKAIAKECDAPVLMTWHTDYAKYAFHKHYAMGIIRFAAKNLMKVFYHDADVIAVPSEKAKMILDGYEQKQPNVVIPNGIILSRFQKKLTPKQRLAMLKQYGISEDKKILVIVSRLSSEKNIDELIEYYPALLEKSENLHLLIAGTGPDQTHLENLVEKLGVADHVTFTGFVQPEETYRYYRLGVAFLSASTFEMHSLTYLEAMACGLPLICRDDPCLLGVLDDGVNGFSYRTKEEFVEKVTRLLNDEQLCQRLSENALLRSENFSEEAFAKRTLEIYRDMCERKKEAEASAK